jgi:squalene-hopene/tetraprenyl-beta-curcumene cyclase
MRHSSSPVTALDRTIDALAARLLAERTAAGHWVGHLATSALSTATAVIALRLSSRAGGSGAAEAARGVEWLLRHQHADGGWGDTVQSVSNLSTTALCWAALPPDAAGAIARAETWIRGRAGSLDPDALARAIAARYGKDRTFSVPILMVLALSGRIGDGAAAWRRVPQLPFELAVCPHQWFEWLRLPVVSYALPALIAIGHVRHHHAPTRNPLTRGLRALVGARTLSALRRMQPASGGYLEATPLTSFVVMSLLSARLHRHPTVGDGVAFLLASQRHDGGWPIDSNLATWATTLSIEALPDLAELDGTDRRGLVDWLVGQQVRQEHPFTHAAPGGWAWTDLSGGVPDADDTAGALLALARLAPDDARVGEAAAAGVRWLLDLQNRDGGLPTFCRGWGALPFDRSAPDLTAHAIRAWRAWQDRADAPLQSRIAAAIRRATRYLVDAQQPDGSWVPLWFGNQHALDEANRTYGTARVLPALDGDDSPVASESTKARRRGLAWLCEAQNVDGGWGGAAGTPSSIEETGLALRALADNALAADAAASRAIERGAAWLIAATDDGHGGEPSPIGLYFARLWYFERLYPIVFGLGGLSAARARLAAEPGG